MNQKNFKDLTTDSDTKIISRTISKIKEIPFAHELWSWDGIKGESIIFYTEDVLSFSDEDIIAIVFNNESKNIKDFTLKRTEKFVFLNFNFQTS